MRGHLQAIHWVRMRLAGLLFFAGFLKLFALLAFYGSGFLLPFSANAQSYEPGDLTDEPIQIVAALQQLKKGEVDQAVERLYTLAGQGYNSAFFHLAELYRLGTTIKKDTAKALYYYQLAARMGHGRAALSYANLSYFSAILDFYKEQQALAIWYLASLHGEPEADYILGTILWNGEGLAAAQPLWGYGLVWRATQKAYGPATAINSQMVDQLDLPQRAAGRALLRENGLLENLKILPDFDTEGHVFAPWWLELGLGFSEMALGDLKRRLNTGLLGVIRDKSLIMETLDIAMPEDEAMPRPSLKLGPFLTMEEAVRFCYGLQKAGEKCWPKQEMPQ